MVNTRLVAAGADDLNVTRLLRKCRCACRLNLSGAGQAGKKAIAQIANMGRGFHSAELRAVRRIAAAPPHHEVMFDRSADHRCLRSHGACRQPGPCSAFRGLSSRSDRRFFHSAQGSGRHDGHRPLTILAIIGIFALFGYAVGFFQFSGQAARNDLTRLICDSEPERRDRHRQRREDLYANEAYMRLSGARDASQVKAVERLLSGVVRCFGIDLPAGASCPRRQTQQRGIAARPAADRRQRSRLVSRARTPAEFLPAPNAPPCGASPT